MDTKAMVTTAAIVAASVLQSQIASAALISCSDDIEKNHMLIDSSYVSVCKASGLGNLSGDASDAFLTGAGSAYSYIGDSGFVQNLDTGTFQFDPAVWDGQETVAIGFKFGTNNQPDEWFVYSLNAMVFAGTWEFVNVFDRGGGLAEVRLYGIGVDDGNDDDNGGGTVPVPASWALLGLGLAALVTRKLF